MPSPLNGLTTPAASPTTRNVGPVFGPTEPRHRDPEPRRRRVLAGVDLPAVGDPVGERVEQMGVLTPLKSRGRQQADADVDGAVADRDHPAVPGDRLAVGIGRRGPTRSTGRRAATAVRPDRGAVRPVAVPGVPRARPNRLLAPSATTTNRARTFVARRAGGELVIDRERGAAHEAPLDDRAVASWPSARGAGLGGAVGDLRVEVVAAQRGGVTGEIGVSRPRRGDLAIAVHDAHAREAVTAERSGSTSSSDSSCSARGVSTSPQALCAGRDASRRR